MLHTSMRRTVTVHTHCGFPLVLLLLTVVLFAAGMGRYGQDLYNTASLALKQTSLLKKKSANRTAKTVRQLRNAKEHSCEAAQKAVEATRAAEKAVQNLAQFAGNPHH